MNMNTSMAKRLQALAVGFLGVFFLLLVHGPAHGATFCVSTAPELASALLQAENNGEDDVIRVVQGSYRGNFAYSSSEAHRLAIEGGYEAGCGSRVVDPANTVLDGMETGTVLVLDSSQVAEFRVDGLTLQNGSANDKSRGGGLFVFDIRGTLTLTNNTITENSASSDGGGVSVWIGTTVTLTNNTITENSASQGGGVFVWEATTVTLTNNTITGNSAGRFGGGMLLWLANDSDTANMYNNIVWRNTAARGADLFLDNDRDKNFLPSPVNLFHNDFDWSTIFIRIPFAIDPSNLKNLDPLFVDPENGDYHVQVGSPVINMGDNEAPRLPEKDKDGNPRIQDGVVDLGPLNFLVKSSRPLTSRSSPFR